MGLACGIVGLPNVGKSTLFNAITAAGAESANYPFCTIEPNVGVVDVPDANLDVLHRFQATERVVPAALKIVDIAGLVKGASQGEGLGNKFLANIKEVDALLHVVRCFRKGDIVHVAGSIDPRRDIEIIELELALADLDTVNRALERVAKRAKMGDKEAGPQHAAFLRAQEALQKGVQLRTLEWKPAELEALSPLCLMTAKRVLFVANVGDDDLEGRSPDVAAVRAHADASGAEAIVLCTDIEAELMRMAPEDRSAFLADLHLPEPGLHRLIRQAYHLLGLQTFYTCGPKEIRAWTIHRGDTGPVAAGVIHSDFEKHYIRAEVYSVADLERHGSEAAIRAAGRLRVEGRDYVMRDGDVAHFLVGK